MLDDSNMRGVLLVFGVAHLALGAYMAIDPGAFFDGIGGFGAQNDHYIRDAATFPLAIGVAGLLAASRTSWRVPILVLSGCWYAFHAVNHAFDVNGSNKDWVGLFDVVSLVLGAILIFWLARQAQTLERHRRIQ